MENGRTEMEHTRGKSDAETTSRGPTLRRTKQLLRFIDPRELPSLLDRKKAKIGGVPREFFKGDKDIDQIIVTKNGKRLHCKFSDRRIYIYDEDNDDFHFSSTLNILDDSKKIVGFSINTTNSEKERVAEGYRYPDLYPSLLFAEALKYFDKKISGNPVEQIRVNWFDDYYGGKSVNFDEYHANLAALGKDPTEITLAEREEAVRNTWTGRLAQAHGFTDIKDINDSLAHRIDVTFAK